MTTPREKYERRRQRFDEYVDSGEIDADTGQAVGQLLDAYDDHNVMETTPEGESSREPGTLRSWCYRLMQFSREIDLTEATVQELKQEIQRMHDGSHPLVKDGGIQKSTLRSYQAALRKFYGHHDYGIEPNEIPLFDQKESHIEPADMLTKEEIQEAREAAGNPRDRAIFELLLYTGQRREAIRTLRLKDIDIEEGTYRYNPNVDGLKGAQDRNGTRPLLGAKGPLQDWLEFHPDTSDPEHYLITARPGYSAVDPSEPVSGETIRNVMSNIKEKTDIEKAMHPHAMRHNFVTICKRDYEMADDTIKYLIGHDSASNVMETTYANLSGADYTDKAKEKAGMKEPEDDGTFTPDVCNVCGNPLRPNAKACSTCGTVYTPDAKSAEDQMQEQMKDGYKEVDPENADTMDKLELLDQLLDDPEIKAMMHERMDKD